MKPELKFTPGLYQQMLEDTRACLPEEACGLLGGKNGVVQYTFPITNILHSPVAFRMNAEDQYKIFLWLEEAGLELVGIYHSHPNGPPHPSESDLAEFYYPGVPYIICSFGDGQTQVYGFMIEGQNYQVISLT